MATHRFFRVSMIVAAAATLAWMTSTLAVTTTARSDQAAPTGAAPQTAGGGYVGVAKCASCHAPEAKGYREGPHSTAWDVRTPAAAKGCESCHGPGESHVADVGAKGRLRNFKTMRPREVNEFCITCHNREEHAQWNASMHDARNLSCISCHSNHTAKSESKLLKKETITATCAQCHREKAAKLLSSAHMPVREGKMECTTCHNQHGSTNVRMLRIGNTVNELCTSCHAEKRGPFLWEHPPVREACVTCHDPHGSSNDRMLVAKVPYLCQRCHVATQHPATMYDNSRVAPAPPGVPSSRIIGRACVNCHAQIHGSNHPSGFRFHR